MPSTRCLREMSTLPICLPRQKCGPSTSIYRCGDELDLPHMLTLSGRQSRRRKLDILRQQALLQFRIFLSPLSRMSHDQAFESLQQSLDGLRQKQLSIATFCRQWRDQTSLLHALPPRYVQVMEDLLGRMETGSLFTEESCSFSQEDLQSTLAAWLLQARQRLAEHDT